MKLTIILVLAASLHSNAGGYAQSITLSLKNASLEKAFTEIRKQSGYDYVFNSDVKTKDIYINVELKQVDIRTALDKCLEGLQLSYSIENKMIVIKVRAREQVAASPPLDVRGRIINEQGEPVSGVTVTVKGTQKATSTDENGFFVLKGIDENATLVFTGTNTDTYELKINGKSDLASITLKTKLGELKGVEINTGYQVLSPEKVNGSYHVLNNKLLNEQVSTSILNRLEPIANGLNVDRRSQTPGIMIRGLSTILGPKGALVIVDNFPYDGDINNINPNDVESVTILKDAAAASIWGTKAGNGVIVITTKKGQLNQRFSVEVNSNFTIGDRPDLFYAKQIDYNDFIDLEVFLFSKGFKLSDTAASNKPPITPVYEILLKRKKGLISAADSANQINALRGHDIRNEYMKYFYRTSFNQQYAINLRGGSANMGWIFTAGVDRNVNELSAEYNRYNLRFQNIYQPLRNLQVTTGLAYTQTKSITGAPAYNTAGNNLPPYTQFADANGNPVPVMKDYRQLYLDTAGAGKLLNWNYYPLEDYKHDRTKTDFHDILASVGINYRIIPGLTIDVKYLYERQQGSSNSLHDESSYLARNFVNQFSQLNRTTGVVTYKVPRGAILDITNNLLTSHNLRGQVNYSKHWTKHSITAIAGAEIRRSDDENNSFRTYGYNPDLRTQVAVDFVNSYPHFITGSNSFIPNSTGFVKFMNRYVSVYSNAAYTYNDKYTVSLSGRRDASNIFGINTNDKWKPLWSAGAGWLISGEDFYKSSLLPYLRLRLTYGVSGNVDPSKTAVSTIAYQSVANPYTLSPWASINRFANPDLRWEKVAMVNAGFDFRSRNNRITGTIEFYSKRASDLFGSVPIDITTGASSPFLKNVATIRGRGLDLDLNTLNFDGKFKWQTQLNFSLNQDKVLDYYLNSEKGTVFTSPITTPSTVTAAVGRSVYGVYSYRWMGLDPLTGDPIGFINGHTSKNYNAITGDSTLLKDLVYHGPAFPRIFGSIGNTFSWKNFSVSMRIMYKFGYWARRPSIEYAILFNNRRGHSDYAKRWQRPGDELFTNVPSLVYPAVSARDNFYNQSEVTVFKGDHIRMQYITLSYELLRSRFKKLPVERLQVYINFNNLGILWRANHDGIDPDYRASELGPTKTTSFGLRIGL